MSVADDQVVLPVAPGVADQERCSGGRQRGRAGRPRWREVVGCGSAALGDRPRRIGSGEARVSVVAAALEEVDLVVFIGSVLDLPDSAVGRKGEPLRIAMAEAVDGVAERVVGGNGTVEMQPQHLAVEPIRILGAILGDRQVGIADAEPEVLARVDLHRTALVAGGAGHLADRHDLERSQRAVRGDRGAQELDAPAASGIARRADEHDVVVDGDPHEPGLELGANVGDRRGVKELRVRLTAGVDAHAADALGDQHASVIREGDVPRVVEAALDDLCINRLERTHEQDAHGNASDQQRDDPGESGPPRRECHVPIG